MLYFLFPTKTGRRQSLAFRIGTEKMGSFEDTVLCETAMAEATTEN
jgi:hypothetical protein